MKILHSADWHIMLGKKKIPDEWQINRFKEFFNIILELEKQCDIHIIAGDVFDKKPSLEEIALFADYANKVETRTIIIPGNHEATKKGETFLETFITHEKSINNPNIEIYTKNKRIEHNGVWFQLFPYGEMQKNNLPSYIEGDILVSHIRGEIPPHVSEEYSFEKLRPWKLILLGDLHHHHKYKDLPAYYPGSPMNVTFDRHDNKDYYVNIIHFNSIDDYRIEGIPLKLPKLIRKTIQAGHSLEKDKFNHVIYEITGSVDELASIENNELLDKKIAYKPKEESQLDLSVFKNVRDELQAWLEHNKISDIQGILDEFIELGIED